MLGKDALARNRQRDLRQFLRRFCPNLDKTRGKFFRHSLPTAASARSIFKNACSTNSKAPTGITTMPCTATTSDGPGTFKRTRR